MKKVYNKSQKVKKDYFSEEFIFVLYFWGSTILRPILQLNTKYSTTILLTFTILLFIISLFKMKNIILKPLYIVIGTLIIILLDFLLRKNSYTTEYLYDFIISGVLPIYFFTQIKKPLNLLKIYSIFSLIVFLIYGWDPLNQYKIFIQDMSYGFELAVPAYLGIHIGRRFFKYKWWILPEIICLISIIIFANSSSILSIIAFWVFLEFFVVKKRMLLKIFITSFLLIIFMFFLPDIITLVQNYISKSGLSSYSFYKYQYFFSTNNIQALFSGRFDIWRNALLMFKENIIFGHGTGSFHSKYGTYPHNIILDVLTQYGIIGLCILIFLLVKSFKNLKKQEYIIKIIGVIFLSIWFPKLFLSIHLFQDKAIWCFFAFGFLKFQFQHLNNNIKINRRYQQNKYVNL